MQLPEIDFSNLEIKEIGAWPLILRVAVIIGGVLAAMVLVYLLIFARELGDLDSSEKQLTDKKAEFKDKYTQAINLDAYRTQMKDMQTAYEEYVKELPASSNIPELIDSITKLGEKNGLKFNSIKIGDPKLVSGFYMTLPLTLDVLGTYHSLGLFISDVAMLSRIVTISDFTLKPISEEKVNIPGLLQMNLDAQTYWLASANELEQQKANEAKANAKPGAPKGGPPTSGGRPGTRAGGAPGMAPATGEPATGGTSPGGPGSRAVPQAPGGG